MKEHHKRAIYLWMVAGVVGISLVIGFSVLTDAAR